MRRLIAAGFVAVLLLAAPSWGQTADAPATLVADRVLFDSETRLLTAEGNVEILQGETRLSARRIVYDGTADRIDVQGPITLQEGDRAVVLADAAKLSADMQNGILQGARLVLNRQLQIAAAEVKRVDGRYTQMKRTIASSCRICKNSETPIWQIRASSVIHDEVEREIYFEHARLEVFGLPVGYVPRLRLPDPTVKRASGLLVPEFRSTDNLGTGIKLPYFITLGDHADVTLTPYLTTTESQTLEMRYRRRYRSGDLNIRSAVSSDELTRDQFRGYVFADGRFAMPRGFELTFDVEAVTDPGYLLEYGYSDKDRLDSSARVARTRRDEHIETELIAFQTLRDDESNRTIPSTVALASLTRRFTPGRIGGIASVTLEFYGLHRTSDTNGPLGRDVLRASARADWRRNWVLENGMVLAALGAVHGDLYAINQDSAFSSTEWRGTPFLGAELRWPLVRSTPGASHVLEPVAQLVWSPNSGNAVPNEDSLLVEFDETNLFSLSRFSGIDAVERGLRANLGLAYTRHDPDGWSLGVAVGRVVRERNLGQFSGPSGLSGSDSDWVAAVHLSVAPGFSIINRAVFDDTLSVSKAEMRLAYLTERIDLASSFVWLEADPAESRPKDLSEWSFNAGYQINEQWATRVNWRYDVIDEEPTRAGLGLTWKNECIAVDLSLSRRFTSSTNVNPSTDLGLAISLTGFGDRGITPAYVHRCSG